MYCRHCGEELKKGSSRCENCNKNNMLPWQMIVAGVAAVLVLGALAVVLFFGLDLDFLKKEEPKTTETEQTEQATPAYESDVDYTGSEEQIAAAAETVVATVNEKTLNNRVLQYYYNMEVYNYVSTNYSYLSDMGLDYTKPLNEQKCYGEDMSWEAYFVRSAIETWKQYQAVYFLAKEAGFELSAETQDAIDAIPTDLAEMAEEEGYESIDAWLKACLYADLTLDDYVEYCTIVSYYTEYISVEPDAATLADYYTENEDYFKENSVDKEAGPMVDVRHILISPEGGTEGESGYKTYTEEEWVACKEKAEEIYDEWKSGEATEESFATLANEKSADGGSNTNGGLYTGITAETQFVEPFLNWSIDESREVGDTDLVKTEHGYHIMYFSGSQPVWEYYAKMWYAQDREITLAEEGTEKWPAEIDYDVICIDEFNLGE